LRPLPLPFLTAGFRKDVRRMLACFPPEDVKRLFLDLRQMESFARDPLVIERADGIWYWDASGRKIMDGISGIFVVTIGHNNRRVIEAVKEQMEKVCFAPPLHATNVPALKLAKRLAQLTPEDLNSVKLLSGGSEATEAAMKLARQYHRQTGSPGKYKVIARYLGFHGATMGALSATGTKRRKTMFEPITLGSIHVMPPTCYRCPYRLEYPSCNVLCARYLEDVIDLEGAETVSAVILEPIGNTGGIVTPPPEYLPIIREICTKCNVLLIFDEIITGFGRTGNMFAAQTFGVAPDILCMGKGMSSGYSPLAAIAFRDGIAAAFWGRDEDAVEFSHGHTYGGNPLASAAGLACLEEITERNLCARAVQMGDCLRWELRRLVELGIVGDVRGRGLLMGVELVKDPATKEPFGNDVAIGVKIGKKALQNGLLLRFDPHWVAFAPPLIITETEIVQMVDILVRSAKEVLAQL
jgi:adenosylmethionine-8-amino-7-oxononanoate aminotransferase